MTTLIIVESPSKAQHIQEYLGNDYIVLASKGHITELAKGGHFGLGVDILNGFKPKYILSSDKVDTFDAIINAAKQCDNILLATDPDLEGEAIAYQISKRLEDFDKPIKRVVFNEIKKAVVLKALKSPRDIDMQMVKAQEARRILDRLIGFLASPFVMNYFGNKLSAGRVQSPLTRMVIDREIQIEQFVPEDFWTIQANLSKDGKQGFITKYTGRPVSQQDADDMKAILAAKGAQFVVSEVAANDEVKYPGAPMITSTLQRIMSKEHGISAEQTMKAAQSLYENGYVSYIRTDSTRSSDESIEEAREWLKNNKQQVPTKPNIFKNKETAQDAHECIRPVDISLDPKNNFAIIDPDEKKVYEVIWKHFVASQAMPAVYSTLKVVAHVQGNKSAEVKASGKAVKSRGYLDILEIEDDSKIEVPLLNVGDILTHFGKAPVKMEKKQTQPPPRYSEDKLLKAMEDKGIGRPSTYAELLSRVAARNYVEKHGNVYHATDLGKRVIEELSKHFTFLNYDYTGNLEAQMDKIMSGEVDQLSVIKECYDIFSKELKSAYLSHTHDNDLICEKCSYVMIKTNGKFGEYYRCANVFCKNTKNIA
jgi:DNA topoisomerase-1